MANKERFSARFSAARSFAASIQAEFQIWTEREIRTPSLDRAKFLAQFKHQDPDPDIARILYRQLCSQRQGSTVRNLLSTFEEDRKAAGKALRAVWCLLADGTLQADFDGLPDLETIVSLTPSEIP